MIRTEGRHQAGVEYAGERDVREAQRLSDLLPQVLARYGWQLAVAEVTSSVTSAECASQGSSCNGHGEVPCWS